MQKSPVHLFLIFAFSFGVLMPGNAGPRVASAFGGHGGCSCLCPSCGEQCYLDISEGKEKRHCWEVETKQVCIPPVHFSCNRCPASIEQLMSKPARTRTVRVLKKKEYECPKCKYEWKQLEVEEKSESAEQASDQGKSDETATSSDPSVQYEYEPVESEYESEPAWSELEYESVPSELAPVVDQKNIEMPLPSDAWQGNPAPASPDVDARGIIEPSTSLFKPQFRMPQRISTINSPSRGKSAPRRISTAGRSNRNSRR